MKIAPSMLSCDFSKMGEELVRIDNGGADLIHLDVMDGHFVPNITIGSDIVSALRPYSKLPFDVHLMIDYPFDYIEQFSRAGADIIAFHIEAKSDITATIEKINSFGVKPGLVIKPNTPAESVFPYLDKVYMILIMTVEPGFGGQSFMADMLPKAAVIKNKAAEMGLDILVEADGGVNENTIAQAARAGIDICVSGTGVFKAKDASEAISNLKRISDNALK